MNGCKAKFNVFFNDAFENDDTIKFEYDNDSIVLIKPGLYFNQVVNQNTKRSRSKKRNGPDDSETKEQVNVDTDEVKSEPKDETKERPESKLLLDPANFEARKPRTRQSSDRKRQSSTSSITSQNNSTNNEPKATVITDRTRGRSPSDDEAPNKRVRNLIQKYFIFSKFLKNIQNVHYLNQLGDHRPVFRRHWFVTVLVGKNPKNLFQVWVKTRLKIHRYQFQQEHNQSVHQHRNHSRNRK